MLVNWVWDFFFSTTLSHPQIKTFNTMWKLTTSYNIKACGWTIFNFIFIFLDSKCAIHWKGLYCWVFFLLTRFGQQLFKMERSPLFTINTIIVENVWGAIIWWIIDPWKPKNTAYVFYLLHCAHGNKCPRPCVMLLHLLSTNLTFFMVQEQLHEFLSTLLHSSHWLVDIICSKFNVCTFLHGVIVE